MWQKDFNTRLQAWSELRSVAQSQSLSECLVTVNDWWQKSPWVPYYLHWDDVDQWPDPWQILADNVCCDVVKSLGICYTLIMLNRGDHGPVELIQTRDGYTLAYLPEEKYLLNMDGETVVNTEPPEITRRLTQDQISKRCS